VRLQGNSGVLHAEVVNGNHSLFDYLRHQSGEVKSGQEAQLFYSQTASFPFSLPIEVTVSALFAMQPAASQKQSLAEQPAGDSQASPSALRAPPIPTGKIGAALRCARTSTSTAAVERFLRALR